ncbi:MAG TPA: Fe-S cluster assembly protein SufD [Casimicrobiaceae bacterium]
MTGEPIDRFVADFNAHAAALPGAHVPWIASLRRDAIERFAEHGLPTSRDEDWKYTSVAPIARRPFAFATKANASVDAKPFALAGVESHRLVFIDGHYAPSLSEVPPLPAGVTLGSLADALDATPDALGPFLRDDRRHTIFAALNTAFMADGLYLRIAPGVALNQPIHVLFVSTASDAAIHPRNLIVAGERAQATLIEQYVGLDDAASLTNAVTQIFAGAGASIAHYKLQQENAHSLHMAGLHVAQARGSRFASQSIALGAALSRQDLTTSFDAEGCDAELNGLFVAGGRQHVDHHTRIDHAQPHGRSRELYKGVLDGGARGVFNGKVVVHPGAQRSDAHLASHNLLLSKMAEIDTKPELTIDADDVKCAHGATVGQLDDDALFYLRARGVDEPMARALLTYAFAHDVIERVRVASLRNVVERALFARLPQGERIRELG